MLCSRIFLRIFPKFESFIQVRNTAILPPRKPVAVYTKKDYESYLQYKTKKKKRANKKVAVSPKEEGDIISSRNKHTSELSEGIMKLKYKKLRNMPGNVLNRMMFDAGASIERPNQHLCFLENSQLIREALNADGFVKNIYFNRMKKLEQFPCKLLKRVHLTHFPDRVLKSLPNLCNNGLFAVATVQNVKSRQAILDKRREAERKEKLRLLSTVIICEGIKDSEEMGRVLKCAEENGCQQAFILDDCVDVWNIDVLRTAEGAHFKLPIVCDLNWEVMVRLKFGENLYIMHSNKNNLALKDFVSPDTLKRYEKSSKLINILEEESSSGTLSTNRESEFVIPSKPCHEVNLLAPSMLLCGNISAESFYFATYGKFNNCFAINVEDEDSTKISTQLNYLFQQAKQQRIAKSSKINK